ncbi:MAG: tRNA pseudouridine(55) synthase TruB [Hyphomicrobiales bacterium]
MGRSRKRGRDVNGWVILDKPVGMTSTQGVGAVRRLFDARKAGHAGTLDPLASGCLPIALGEATKTVPYVMDGRKVYEFAVRFGAETATDDTEGEVVATSDNRPTEAEILAALPLFTGEIEQVPPKFSAIKIDGERAYDLARDGEEVELEARTITVYSLDLVERPDDDTAVFEAECGKGTYVRAIARDLGRHLGTRGHVVALRRLVVGAFDEDTFVTLDELRAAAEASETGTPDELLQPVEAGLAELPTVAVSRNDVGRLRQGQGIILRGRDAPVAGGMVVAVCAGEVVALAEVEKGMLQPRRVFSLG